MMRARQFVTAGLTVSVMLGLAACSLLLPPPSYVQASVILKGKDVPTFLYLPSIVKERELRRERYYLAGVQIREAECPGSQCDRLVWDTKNDAVWDPIKSSEDLVLLPKNITYGEVIPGMRIVIAAESLRPDITYSVVIGIMGSDENYQNRFYFAAQTSFKLREDNGKIYIK